MKQFISYFKDYHNTFYNRNLYITFAIVLFSMIFGNQFLHIEDKLIRNISNPFLYILTYILEFFICYSIGVIIVKIFKKDTFKITKEYVLYALIAIIIISIDRSINVFTHNIKYYIPRQIYPTSFYTIANATSTVTMLIPLTILKYVIDKNEDFGLYGLRFKGVSFSGYKTLIYIIIPLVFFASFIPEFIQYYPTYKKLHGSVAAEYLGIPEFIIVLVYEFIYLFDFLFTELGFRGLLIIGLSRFIGKNSILPMVMVYAILHFGKPLGETISSVFGGYILGVLALYSRNIWGGVALHCGVALFMEIFAYMQLSLH